MFKTDPRKLLAQIAQVLDKVVIPYLVTGGMAVVAWGRPRYTADIDTVIELRDENIEILAKALMKLGKAGYISTEAMKEALQMRSEFNFIDGNTGMKVDFWISRNDEFARSQFQRRIAQDIYGTKVYFASPEDLILSKLQWYKLSSSTRHLEDIETVFAVSGAKIDREYLAKWVAKLDVQDIYNKLDVE